MIKICVSVTEITPGKVIGIFRYEPCKYMYIVLVIEENNLQHWTTGTCLQPVEIRTCLNASINYKTIKQDKDIWTTNYKIQIMHIISHILRLFAQKNVIFYFVMFSGRDKNCLILLSHEMIAILKPVDFWSYIGENHKTPQSTIFFANYLLRFATDIKFW